MRHILHGRLSYLVFVFALVLAFPSAVSAADPSDFVVRAAGMGGAYTALSSGPAGLIYNPAGIGLRIFEATVNLSAPTMDDLTTLGMLLQDFDPDLVNAFNFVFNRIFYGDNIFILLVKLI